MSYVSGVLSKEERVVYQGRVSIWSLLPLFLVGLVFLGAYGLGVLFWVAAAVRYITTEIAITNKRVIAKAGFISRSTIEINLQRIESLQVRQGVLGRILNFGSVIVSGAGNPQAPIVGISDPLKFRKVFVEAQENANNNKGRAELQSEPKWRDTLE